jgi:hypothetical protein
MDQRREPRFEVDQAVDITILTEPAVRLPARVRDASGRGLGLILPQPVPPGVAVRIELADAIVLGEAIYCRDEQNGFFVGVELDQVLVGLTELGRKLSAWETQSTPSVGGLPASREARP